MKENKGITLISVIITVILLAIIAGIAVSSGIDTYQNSKVIKFETYMKMIQKKVDLVIEEKTDYTTLGSPLTELTSAQNDILRNTIINNAYVDTTVEELEKTAVRYFSAADLENYFDIKGVEDDIIINFANREVISLNGVKKDGKMHYVELGLN